MIPAISTTPPITCRRFIRSPNTVDTPFGTFPACFLPADYGVTNIYPVANCSPTELTLRLSFKRVVDNSTVDRLVKEGFFEQLFGAGIKAEEQQRAKIAFGK